MGDTRDALEEGGGDALHRQGRGAPRPSGKCPPALSVAASAGNVVKQSHYSLADRVTAPPPCSGGLQAGICCLSGSGFWVISAVGLCGRHGDHQSNQVQTSIRFPWSASKDGEVTVSAFGAPGGLVKALLSC
ncbi:hypothetical protein FQA47_021754 [Oryzias melastigma]|uniref:Uncharacterized protein n=1 Tax=Oryzias melastigma TaxID=30732 RepID=A0A834C558_ORYME|nr:hypothetical protein FQA47_021754 [Oryzias melastigma]